MSKILRQDPFPFQRKRCDDITPTWLDSTNSPYTPVEIVNKIKDACILRHLVSQNKTLTLTSFLMQLEGILGTSFSRKPGPLRESVLDLIIRDGEFKTPTLA